MPINVDYSINPGFYSVPFFAAQDQRLQQQQAAEDAERQKRQLALQQLVMQLAQPAAPVGDPYPGVPRHLIGQMNAGIPLQPQAAPQSLPSNRANAAATPAAPSFDPMEKYKIDMDARTKRAAIMAGSYGDQLQAQTSSANQWNNMMGGLLERQMMGGQQFDQQMLAGDQRLGQLQYDANAELRNQAYGDYPAWIAEGINAGRLRYTPEQLTQRNKHEQALDQALSDPSLSPQERMMAEAIHAQAIRDINMRPHEVPPDQWRETPQQIADKLFVKGPDGQWGSLETRNGEQRVVPWKSDGAEQKAEEMKLKQQEAQQKQQQEEAKFYRDAIADEVKLKAQESKSAIDFDKQFFEADLKSITDMRTAEMDGLRDTAPSRDEFTTETPGKDGAATVKKTDEAGYRAAVESHRLQMEAINNKYRPMMEELRQRYESKRQAMQPPSPAGMPSIQPTTPGVDPIQGAMPTPPQQSGDGSQIIGPNSLGEYARKYPDGRIEILSGGAP
jgi:ribosomal protein L9